MKSQYPFGLSLTHLRTVRPELVEGRWQSVRRAVQSFDKAFSPEHGRRVRTNGLQTSLGRINIQVEVGIYRQDHPAALLVQYAITPVQALLIRPDEVLIPVRAEPVEASALRYSPGERTSYFIGPEHQFGTV